MMLQSILWPISARDQIPETVISEPVRSSTVETYTRISRLSTPHSTAMAETQWGYAYERNIDDISERRYLRENGIHDDCGEGSASYESDGDNIWGIPIRNKLTRVMEMTFGGFEEAYESDDGDIWGFERSLRE
eukprot:3833875-Rhodomonas_salina.1